MDTYVYHLRFSAGKSVIVCNALRIASEIQ